MTSTLELAVDDPIFNETIELATDVTTLIGAGDAPMLYSVTAGTYVRLSRGAAAVVSLLDSPRTLDQLVEQLASRTNAPTGDLRQKIALLISDLRRSNVLNLEAPESDVRDRIVDAARRTPLKRVPLVRSPDEALEPLARRLRRIGARSAAIVGALLLVLAVAGITAGLLSLDLMAVRFARWWIVAPLAVLAIAVHESCHAIACRVFRSHVREIGFGLWYWIIPIAYVDRTDAYRVRSRTARATISAVGPLHDAVAAAAAFSCARYVGAYSSEATALGLFLFVALIRNLHPLIPSDGQQAVEALLGELNLRGQSMQYCAARALKKPVPQYLAERSAGRRRVYVLYGTLSIAYLLLMAVGILVAIWRVFEIVR